MLGNQLNKICFVFRCGQRTGYTRFSQRVARFFIFTLLVSTSFLLSIFLRTSVGSFIPPLSSCARFSSNPGSSIFENEFSPIHVGKIVIGHTALVEGRLLARWVYWEFITQSGFSEGGGIKFENGEIVASSQKVKVEFLNV